MRIVITRNLLKPVAAVAFVIGIGLALTASPPTRALVILLIGLAGCVSALLLRLSVIPRGGLWGYSSRSTFLVSVGMIGMEASELSLPLLDGSARHIAPWAGVACFLAGMLLSYRDRMTWMALGTTS